MEKESSNSNFVPKFDGHYDHWAMLMENLLYSKDFWDVVENGIPAPPAAPTEPTQEQLKKIADAKLKDRKAKNYLFQALDRNLLEQILKKDTAKDIWESMKLKFKGTSRVRLAQLQALRRDFEALIMKEEETVTDYFSRTMAIVSKMKMHGDELKESTVVENIIRTMPEKFNYVICAIEYSRDISTVSIDELQSGLIVQEQRMKSQKEEEQVLKVSGSDRGLGRGRGRSQGTGARGRGRNSFNKDHIECFKCGKKGHYKSECLSNEANANYVETEEEEEILLMAYSEDHSGLNGEKWYLDSGCSHHMSGKKAWFFDLDENYKDTVKVGDGRRIKVDGRGNVKVKVNDRIQVIASVFYVPELGNNLLSVGQLQHKGLKVVFENDMCNVFHPKWGHVISSKMDSNNLFTVMAIPVMPTATDKAPATDASLCLKTATAEETTKLWHHRYAHLSVKELKALKQRNMVIGLPEVSELEEVCTDVAT